MTFTYRREYRGKIQAALLDWAGTTMDFGCMAPAVVFVKVFERAGVPITMDEARVALGARHRGPSPTSTNPQPPPGAADVDRMFADFVPLQLECLSEYSALIPGTLEVVGALRARDIKIGSTTGYLREMMAINLADAKAQGYEPDATVCASDVPAGRPYPYMCLQNMLDLRVWPVEACVKVDDTLPGIEEGLNAGMWTVGLAVSGNEVGLPLAAWQALPPAEQQARREHPGRWAWMGGAHYVVDTIADLLPCLDDVDARLARGEKP